MKTALFFDKVELRASPLAGSRGMATGLSALTHTCRRWLRPVPVQKGLPIGVAFDVRGQALPEVLGRGCRFQRALRENARMFERTASRLDEMQSQDWLELPHQP